METSNLTAFETLVKGQENEAIELKQSLLRELNGAKYDAHKISNVLSRYHVLFNLAIYKILQKNITYKILTAQPFTLSEENKRLIKEEQRQILKDRAVSVCSYPRYCTECGRLVRSGEFGVEVDGDDSTCLCMDCADERTEIGSKMKLFFEL